MEPIMNFLEQYWGYTLFGGVTLGTIITFIITQIKTILKGRTKDKNIDVLLNKCEDLCTQLNEEREALAKEKEAHAKDLLDAQVSEQISEQKHSASEQYFHEVIATMFKSLSYLIVASRLPNEDKIELQSKFIELTNDKLNHYKEVIKDINDVYVKPAVTEIKQEITDDVIHTLEEAVKTTSSLLDKYTKE